MLTLQVKNTVLHLNGQNLRVASKNGRISKTPGLHLSATHGKEAVGQLTASSPLQEGTPQLDSLLLKLPRPETEREAENRSVRRPLKLAPLELTEEVREAQRQKLKPEVKPALCKLDVTFDEPKTRKVKSCVRQRPIKGAVSPSPAAQPLKGQKENRASRPHLTRSSPIEQNGDRHLEDVVCRGTPAPLRSKPTPPLLSPRVKAHAARVGQATCQNSGALQQETDRRRLRLRRAQCLEEDQCNSNTSTGGLSADEGKLPQGVQGKGQQSDKAPRGQLHAGKGIKESPAASWEHGNIRRSHQEVCIQQSARCALNRQSGEGGSSEHAHEGVKPSASNWGLKRKKALITKHNSGVPVERLQL